MSHSIIKRPLLEETETSDDEFIDDSFSGGQIQSKYPPRTNSEAELIRYTQNAPEDKYNFAYIVFYLLGIASMLPWNFFLTAEEYWMFKFRNVTDNSTTVLTPIQKSFTADFTVSASIPGTFCLIVNAIAGHLISHKLRMVGSMVMVLIFFIITTAFVEVDTDSWQQGFFIFTLIIVIFINSFAALLTGGLMGIAGLFPSEYITAVVSGQALSGMFSAFADIISLTFGASAKTTAFAYFCVGNISMLISLICYIIMEKTLFFRFHISPNCQDCQDVGPTSSQTVLVTSNLTPNFKEVLRKIYVYAFSEWFVFVVTLSVYPAVTILIQSEDHGNGHPWSDIYFTPVANYLLFNSGDYVGRILAGLLEKPKNSPHLILLMTTVRCAFIPTLMMGNSSLHYFLPIAMHSDVTFITVMAAFAISNGYIANTALIMAPRAVMHHEKEMASSIMAAALGLGIACGSLASMLLVQYF